MIQAEALTLCRLAKAMCPQQAMDEFTPDAWHMLLEDLRFEDCKEALVNLARKNPFVAPAEIRAEVRRIRDKRLADYGPFDPPPEVADYNRWLGEMRRKIADGETLPRPLALVSKPMPELGHLFPAIPRAAHPHTHGGTDAPECTTCRDMEAYQAKVRQLREERNPS